MRVLGIAASHNGAACLADETKIHVAVQEERLTRVKRARVGRAGSSSCVSYCLADAGVALESLDRVVICPQAAAEPEVAALCQQVPGLDALARDGRLQTVPHHLGHAAGAFALSGFERAGVIVIDGLGSPLCDLVESREGGFVIDGAQWGEAASIYRVWSNGFEPVWKAVADSEAWLVPDRHRPRFGTVGGLYALAAALAFSDPTAAGTVMGLAARGTAVLPPRALLRVSDVRFECRPDRLGPVPQRPWPNAREWYETLAATVQQDTEFAVRDIFDLAVARLPDLDAFCFTGGVALNVVANAALRRRLQGRAEFYVPSACEDSGTAVGAAAYGIFEACGRWPRWPERQEFFGRRPTYAITPGRMGSLLVDELGDLDAACEDAAQRIAAGGIVAWLQGRSEFGPRALGHRSFLSDPRANDTRERVNALKEREPFRPVAPAVIADQSAELFRLSPDRLSALMLTSAPATAAAAFIVPSALHDDGSARVQTVTAGSDGTFHRLLSAFAATTSVPLVLNTSFNLRNEPMVETEEDALATFHRAPGVNALYLGTRRVRRVD